MTGQHIYSGLIPATLSISTFPRQHNDPNWKADIYANHHPGLLALQGTTTTDYRPNDATSLGSTGMGARGAWAQLAGMLVVRVSIPSLRAACYLGIPPGHEHGQAV